MIQIEETAVEDAKQGHQTIVVPAPAEVVRQQAFAANQYHCGIKAGKRSFPFCEKAEQGDSRKEQCHRTRQTHSQKPDSEHFHAEGLQPKEQRRLRVPQIRLIFKRTHQVIAAFIHLVCRNRQTTLVPLPERLRVKPRKDCENGSNHHNDKENDLSSALEHAVSELHQRFSLMMLVISSIITFAKWSAVVRESLSE